MNPHLVVSISAHGYGHVAQTAPILNELHRLYPKVRLTVRTSVAPEQLRSRIHAPFTHRQSDGDIGMVMSSALEVDIKKSRAAYHTFHRNWADRVSEEARQLNELQADLVLSNVAYLPLAAAQQAGIPNIALCSLNWADIYTHYCDRPTIGLAQTTDRLIASQIQSSYANADAFLRATPGMPMTGNKEGHPGLTNLIPLAPIAAPGKNRREELDKHLGLKHEKLLLISMGGIAGRLPIENWPRLKGVRLLVNARWKINHPDVISIDALPMCFTDLLASCDALLCKPGYGSFVEAASYGVPVIYVSRADWPESPALIAWLKEHGLSHEITQKALLNGAFGDRLKWLWDTAKPVAFTTNGAHQAAHWLAKKLI
ncbi:MAG: hypothetical protein R8K48_00765 [Gallionella sp.]